MQPTANINTSSQRPESEFLGPLDDLGPDHEPLGSSCEFTHLPFLNSRGHGTIVSPTRVEIRMFPDVGFVAFLAGEILFQDQFSKK